MLGAGGCNKLEAGLDRESGEGFESPRDPPLSYFLALSVHSIACHISRGFCAAVSLSAQAQGIEISRSIQLEA
jgi:hypothetical protein